jgi:hypothetical protein
MWRLRPLLYPVLLLASALAVTGCGATMRTETRAERCSKIVRSDPVFVSGDSPDYTQAALDAGVHGPVRAKCWISDQGNPLQCTLIDHVASMDASVLRALLGIRYQPALVDGSPTVAVIDVTVQLKLPPPGSAPTAPEPPAPVSPASEPSAPGTTPLVMPFGVGMERPKRLAGALPALPAEERRSCSDGLVLARCILNVQGTLEKCRIVASTSPLLSKMVLGVLPTYRYTPVTFHGIPVNVEYTIPVKIKLE